MITITYSGYYNVFTINSDKTVTKIFSHSLLNILPNGVYCAEMDLAKQYLLIGSFASSNSYTYKQTSNGVSIWRLLNTEPWIKHVDIANDHKSKQMQPSSKHTKGTTKMNFSKIVAFCFMFSEPQHWLRVCDLIQLSGDNFKGFSIIVELIGQFAENS